MGRVKINLGKSIGHLSQDVLHRIAIQLEDIYLQRLHEKKPIELLSSGFGSGDTKFQLPCIDELFSISSLIFFQLG